MNQMRAVSNFLRKFETIRGLGKSCLACIASLDCRSHDEGLGLPKPSNSDPTRTI